MIAGTLAGAARLLGVSAPGIKPPHEVYGAVLRVKLFERIQNRYYPTKEAEDIFEQITASTKKVDDLQYVLQQVDRGAGILFSIASVPSLSHFVVPNALKRRREKFPALGLDLDIIKVQEAQDYLLLASASWRCSATRSEHPASRCSRSGSGNCAAWCRETIPWRRRRWSSVAEIARYPLVGVVPEDPYGRIMMDVFRRHGLGYDLVMSVPLRGDDHRPGAGRDRGGADRPVRRAGCFRARRPGAAHPRADHVRTLRRHAAHRPLSRHAAACLQLLREEIRRETRGAP